jgi:ABC-type nickel/cobalt efflux system permease component RcnA
LSAVDNWIAGLGHGAGVTIALIAALLLGLRHATDPDHLTAVSTLALSEDRRGPRRAGVLGLAWGLGHATTLLIFGIPAILLRSYLPHAVDQVAEGLIAAVIIGLAVRLLLRWRRGYFHTHAHRHDGRWHTHPHVHAGERAPAAERAHAVDHAHAADHQHGHGELLGRSPAAAYGIGLIHGMGGTAGVTLLLIAAMPDRSAATIALGIFALATAVSMSGLSALFGTVLASRAVSQRLGQAVPLLGLFSLAFGVYYAAVALAL